MKHLLLISAVCFVFVACNQSYIPKPRGYFRISFPEKTYHRSSDSLPYSFELADYSTLHKSTDRQNSDEWINLATPANKADVHLTFVKLNGDLNQHIEDSRKLAYDHSIKADAINERLYLNPTEKVYGTIYYIEGNAASPIQFYLTDSSSNFIRGALYIREIPNIDSIQPVIDFLEQDVVHLVETFRWK